MSGDHHDPAGDDPRGDEVGSVAEEAVKLLGALSGWAHDVRKDVGDAAQAAHAHGAGWGEHLATGAPECTWCPVCRTVHAVRELSPEVKAHLTTAAASLAQAAAAFLETTPPERGTRSGVEDIDLDADPDLDPEEDR